MWVWMAVSVLALHRLATCPLCTLPFALWHLWWAQATLNRISRRKWWMDDGWLCQKTEIKDHISQFHFQFFFVWSEAGRKQTVSFLTFGRNDWSGQVWARVWIHALHHMATFCSAANTIYVRRKEIVYFNTSLKKKHLCTLTHHWRKKSRMIYCVRRKSRS